MSPRAPPQTLTFWKMNLSSHLSLYIAAGHRYLIPTPPSLLHILQLLFLVTAHAYVLIIGTCKPMNADSPLETSLSEIKILYK